MATHPANDAAIEPTSAGEIILIPVADIDMGERLRPVDPVWAAALGDVMLREGQQTPIDVCRLPGQIGWRLVAGAHRLMGAKAVGIDTIEAREVSNSLAHRKMREVSENLWRRDLQPIDRAAFIAELVTLHKVRSGVDPAKDGRSSSANARWQKAIKNEAADTNDTMSLVYGWSADVGAQLGFSARTVERDLLIFRRLSPSIAAILREARHPILSNASQLRALAKLPEHEQRGVVDWLTRRSNAPSAAPVKTVAAALALVRDVAKPVPDPETKRLSAFIGTFQRMTLAEKRGALAMLAGMLPAGFSIEEAR